MAQPEHNKDAPQPSASIAKDLAAIEELISVAKVLFGVPQAKVYERTLRYLGVSLANSAIAVSHLCEAGLGADAVKIVRSMFETQVSIGYLLVRPSEVQDFIDFDAVARYQRLVFCETKQPQKYAAIPVQTIRRATAAYRGVEQRFKSPNGKVRHRWSRHNLAEMARVAGLGDHYDLFYGYGSALHHSAPIGLTMLIDAQTLDVRSDLPNATPTSLCEPPLEFFTMSLANTPN